MAESIGRYTILRKLGEGGMGIVYAAHDPRLDRSVAIKTMRGTEVDEPGRLRLWREARAAARVSHPNVCQLHEIAEEDGNLFLVMELLEGETLQERIARGALPLDECKTVALAILAALDALHAQDIIHRDLKPANVFLTPVGVKLLDFGLARPIAPPGDSGSDMAITQAGMVVGTPRYMAPELWRGEPVGPAADFFSVGAIVYEMLTGQPAFLGHTMLAVYEKILTYEPPPIAGSAAVARMDVVLHRALRKKATERYARAAVRSAEITEIDTLEITGERIMPRPMVRLIGLPLRVLRPDTETDFLAFSLPDAITNPLAGLGSLAVRSSAVASRFGGRDELDLERIASEADVDVVLSGTLMRANDQLRISAQLLEAPAGTVLWSRTFQTPIQDLFELQDALTQQIVESLAVPLSGRERDALRHDEPSSAQAYEYYLRANQVAYDARHWDLARDLYRKCLDLDPEYAPAWARLGRVYRAISIYAGDHEHNSALAREAFRRALELHPDLSIAHNLSTYLDVELGGAEAAMRRLLDRARFRANDPELFAGLVQALRYCGLLEESIASYERARRIEPTIRTGVAHAYLMHGDYAEAIAADLDEPPYVTIQALAMSGRIDESVALIREREARKLPRLLHDLMTSIRCVIESNLEEARPVMDRLLAEWRSRDPCAAYYFARQIARVGNTPKALEQLRFAVDGGFYVPSFMRQDPWLDSLRGEEEFKRLERRAEERHASARDAFAAADGYRVLGLRR